MGDVVDLYVMEIIWMNILYIAVCLKSDVISVFGNIECDVIDCDIVLFSCLVIQAKKID